MKTPGHTSLDFKHLAALAQDLEASYFHRAQSTANTKYVFDANVIWFLLQQLDEADENIRDYVAAALGEHNAASLIRTSIERLCSNSGSIYMLESHRYETEIAFASDVTRDYEALRKALLLVFERVVVQKSTTVTPSDLPKQILLELKSNHRKDFHLLTDILGRKPQRKSEIDRRTRTLRVDPSDPLPFDLSTTLKKIAYILRDGDARPRFSVSQDIKALRDIALYNSQGRGERAVLVTFDKRLLQAVRLVQSWKEPWSETLTLESCQTFWIWHLADPQTTNLPAVVALQEVMDDFRRKSRQLFSVTDLRDEAQSAFEDPPLWLSHQHTLENLLKHFGENTNRIASDDALFQTEVIQQVKRTLKRAEQIEKDNSADATEVVQNACRLFFNEVEEMLPSFGLIVSDVFERETKLKEMLQQHGMQKADFLDALNEEIQTHAQASLNILGASSLMSPRTIQAVYSFSQMDQVTPSFRRFVHRVPLPILSDDFDFAEVVRLVTNDQTKLQVRYDELLKLSKLAGPVADLIVAYLLANSGRWSDAEDICRGNLKRSGPLFSKDPIYYETQLLLAAILRIYRTSLSKLHDSETLLRAALASYGRRANADKEDFRIKSEFIAIRVNRILFERYTATASQREPEAVTSVTDPADILNDLATLKDAVAARDYIPPALREKINANINVNFCLVSHFVAPSKAIPILGDAVYGKVLTEAFSRLASRAVRISYFEEIVISFSALCNAALVDRVDFKEREVFGSLRSRLSRVLQRDQQTNDFEIWMYRYIQRTLHDIGYRS